MTTFKQMGIVARCTLLVAIFACCILTGCDLELPETDENEVDKVWVYVTVRYKTNDGFQFYYYYGQIEERLFKKISKNTVTKGFVKLEKVRYWNNDNKMELYEDETDFGIWIFRIEDIRKIIVLKGDPVETHKRDELSEKALKFRKRIEPVTTDTSTAEP